ncbi:unnamed protein product [Chrysoparadoxa australica]
MKCICYLLVLLMGVRVQSWASLPLMSMQRVKDIKVGPLKREQVALPTGAYAEALLQKPSSRSLKRNRELPPLLFIHGSYHSAWCWAEHWLPFFAGKGYDTYAMSLRGTSGTPLLPEVDRGKKVKVSSHVDDVLSFIDVMLPGQRPIVITHSFGGMIGLKLLESLPEPTQKLAGMAFFCSVPPSGNGPMTSRFLATKPGAASKILAGFVFKLAASWPWLARELFFSKSLDKADLTSSVLSFLASCRYVANFREDSKAGLDLRDLNSQLPCKRRDENGRAEWLDKAPPRLVVGAENDFIVDLEGVQETAAFLGEKEIILPVSPHDVMLGPDWPLGAARLLNWLEAM